MRDKVSEVVSLLQDYVAVSQAGANTSEISQKIAEEGKAIEPKCEFDGYVKKFSERFDMAKPA